MKSRVSQAGFTLVEMLVALVLLSLVMLGLSSSLRGFAQAEVRIDQRVLRGETARALDGFLREIMGWVSGMRIPGPEGAKPFVALVGGANELVWLGMMPARQGVGGLHYLHLGIEQRERGPSLVLRYIPFKGKPALPDWSTSEAIDLAEDIEELQFQYMGEEKDGWKSVWSSTEKLPSLMRLGLKGLGTSFPELVVRVVEGGGAADAGAGQISIGGGG